VGDTAAGVAPSNRRPPGPIDESNPTMPRLLLLFAATLLWLVVSPAFAQATPPAPDAYPVDGAFTAINSFGEKMQGKVEVALASGPIRQVVNVLFTALAISLFVWKFVGYALRGFDVMDIIELMMSIVFVYILLTSYTYIFPTISQGTHAIGNAIGAGISGLSADESFAKALLGSFKDMTFTPKCDGLDCLGKGIMALVGTAMAWIAVVVLGIAALLVELWVTWGFAIAYAVGWVTIPFMLYERLHFLFDGWLKFFFGMGVYGILAKTNLALVYLAIQKMLKSGTGEGGDPLLNYQVGSIAEVAGLLVFVTVGVFSLFSTNRFAQAIVGGAGGGGIAGMVQSAAKAGANAASGGAGAAAGAAKK
jgi:hypothetical protein